MKPRVGLFTEDSSNKEVKSLSVARADPITQNDPQNWEKVVSSMVGVVHGARGTARRIGADAVYKIAGKTGTAQVFGVGQDEEYDEEKIEKKLRDHALFVSFAPAENPRIAVAVVVENGGSGSRIAAPIARRIMDHHLRDLVKDSEKDGFLLTSTPAGAGDVVLRPRP